MTVCVAISLAASLTGCALEPASDPAPGASEPTERAVVEGESRSPRWMMTSAGPCPSEMVCLYQNANGGGMMVVVTPGAEIPDFKAIPCPGCLNGVHGNDGTFNKQMSSWDNQSIVPYCYYEKPKYDGAKRAMVKDRLTNAMGDEDDAASSAEPCKAL
jgi:hypothetical protein